MAKEYIERDALIERLRINLNACNPGTFSELCYRDAIETTTNFPAADVVEVVRCKDCKYRENGKDYESYCNCYAGMLNYTEADDFCSYGERRGNDGT